MNGFRDYLLIQYKRIFKLLPGIILMIALVAILLSAALFALLNRDAYKSEQMRYKLGLVGSTDNEMIDLGVHLLETEDDMQFVLELVQYEDEAEAKAALRSADISAYIVITDEFADAVDAMTNDAKLTYYATSGQKGISNVMMDEIALVATNIIVPSEKGICTLRDIMLQEGYDKTDTYMAVYEIFMAYVNTMMLRGEISTVTELGISNGLTTPQYYFVSLLLFFLLLVTMCFVSYFIGINQAQHKFFSSKGITPLQQVLGEYIPFLTVNIIVALLVTGLAKLTGLGDFIGVDIGGGFVLRMAVIEALFTGLAFLLYEILEGIINKVLVTFLLYIAGSYASGYFYPRSILPEIMQQVGQWLPTGLAFDYLGGVVTGDSGAFVMVIMIIYVVIFVGGSVLIRRRY
ncbi:MAG: ABC transporter permease [Pseudobutyrivibrio sp.]|uniref:ABC transporter permease n=1 Tax=Pseudobutyrivibrio sp. TaxID=2014367 RepID=UPI0025E5DEFC|nr:ABC transporter permease [Pseudobutyrivibrio sp.]MBQ8489089.1 ABC transporter permease [Pseudobutyrivibrio sp.]